ncbi:calcium/manganese antiporter SLC30A10 [Anopheles bellator]|uniref:calcium/manganese antiporter SLC30A10 n=1 Tax=Anopheles bellator TaxID=139047 RepID=UPI002649FDA9|nr:calcium/manganese antiporter SLC30A10 [Anopheles bellator]
MPMKEWIYQLQPVQLYIVLALSTVYFAVQLFVSHISHSLVLLVNSYHMMCNIIALTGCILTIKKSAKHTAQDCGQPLQQDARSVSQQLTDPEVSGGAGGKLTEVPLALGTPEGSSESTDVALDIKRNVKAKARAVRETSLKNTFGWTRIDILTMLVVCIFMASFCFSAVVEALQTLFHMSHHGDAMHFAGEILVLASLGLILNGICYLLIGGYTYHQGSFLYITSSGNVIIDHSISGDGVRKGNRRLSGSRHHDAPLHLRSKSKRESVRELMRDICSTVIVIVCSLIVYYTTEETSKFVDPALAIVSCVILITLSYPYMKESGMILLQTIPDTIDIEIFKRSLLDGFKDIDSVHDLHIWQLSRNQYVSTVHIIFESPKVFHTLQDDVIAFFHEQGIYQVTIQPEFKTMSESRALGQVGPTESCLIQCRTVAQCASRQCCDTITGQEDGAAKAPLLTEVITEPGSTQGGCEKIPMTPMEPPSGQQCLEEVAVIGDDQQGGSDGVPAEVLSSSRSDPVVGNSEEKDSPTVQTGPAKTDCEQPEPNGS